MSIASELTTLRDRAWTTSGSRYNAARRLRTRSRLSLATISLISALGVAIPLLLASGRFGPDRENLALFSSILSLFILVVAVIEGASGFDAKADTLFRSGELLNAFRARVNVVLCDSTQHSIAALQELTDEYERLKESCPINHEVVDFRLLRADHPSDYGLSESAWRSFFSRVHYFAYSTWWLLLISVIAVVGLWMALSAAGG